MKYFVAVIVLIVAAAVVAGFFIIGSPQQERLRLSDQRRVEDLQTTQWQIVNYWQRKGVLPKNIADLRDDISGFLPPTDPENKTPYGYEVLGLKTFTLCAKFNLPSADANQATTPYPAGGYSGQSWQHPAGNNCFERSIDEDFYKTEKSQPPRPAP